MLVKLVLFYQPKYFKFLMLNLLREFLAHFYNKINIVSFEKLVFPDIQQEVVLLLCEKNKSKTHLIEHLELRDAEDLKTLDVSKLKSPKKQIDFKSNKWTFYFLEQNEIDFLETLQNSKLIPRFKEYAKVEVGITTGSNPFFTVPLSIVQFYNLEEYAKPLVWKKCTSTKYHLYRKRLDKKQKFRSKNTFFIISQNERP